MFKSRKFDYGTKMIAIAPHHLIYTDLVLSYKVFKYYQFGVGYCFIRTKGNARA
ncbi:unknown [Bacteroides sp. CAG:661]|nr:unknown [Bacteroides sp. CAG:661]